MEAYEVHQRKYVHDHIDEVKSSIFKEGLAWLSGTGTGTLHTYNNFV